MQPSPDSDKIQFIDAGEEAASEQGDRVRLNGGSRKGSADKISFTIGEPSAVDKDGKKNEDTDDNETKEEVKKECVDYEEDPDEELLKEYCRANFHLLQQRATKAARKEELKNQILDTIFTRKPREYSIFAFTVILFFIIVIAFIVVLQYHTVPVHHVYRRPQGLTVNMHTLSVQFENSRGEHVLTAKLWRTRPVGSLPNDCTAENLKKTDLCLTWTNQQKLNIVRSKSKINLSCYDFSWQAVSTEVTQMDCFELGKAHWYGGGLMKSGVFWLGKLSQSKKRFLTGTFHDKESLGPVLERYWVTSNGVAVIAQDGSPLQISINEKVNDETHETDELFCLYADPIYVLRRNDLRSLNAEMNYSICIGDSIRHVHQETVKQFGNDLSQGNLAPRKILSEPVWSTWSFMKTNFSQWDLIDFARMIDNKGYRHSLLMIDSGWETHSGDLQFDKHRFNNVSMMSARMRELSFNSSLSVHFYINTDSVLFQKSIEEKRLVSDVSDTAPGLVHWWHGPQQTTWQGGVAALINIASRNVCDWMTERLELLTADSHLDHVHLSGGEASSLPLHAVINEDTKDPNYFTRQSCLFASSLHKGIVSVQSAYKCQGLPLLVRLSGSSSTWSGPEGLNSVIPSALSLGLIGYPVFIPDAIGGTSYSSPPSAQLFIRWLEIVTFFPIVHFSIPPDSFQNETVASAVSDMMQLRDTVVIPEIDRVLNDSLLRLTPIVRPVWWNEKSDDDQLFEIEDQFLVGDNILVAPIIIKNSYRRDIYLPRGLWQDNVNDIDK